MPAWQKPLGSNKDLICHSFEKVGIWPVNQQKVLPLIASKETASIPSKTLEDQSESEDIVLKTPLTINLSGEFSVHITKIHHHAN